MRADNGHDADCASVQLRADVVGKGGNQGEIAILAAQDPGPLALRPVERVVGRGLDQIPRAFCDLGLQLTGSPSGVAGVDADPVTSSGGLVDRSTRLTPGRAVGSPLRPGPSAIAISGSTGPP